MCEVTDDQGLIWKADVTSHGTTSGYLNPKVHRPVVQFSCATRTLPRRYAPLPLGADTLEELNDAGLLVLLERARVH
jgi:hypothetical protein